MRSAPRRRKVCLLALVRTSLLCALYCAAIAPTQANTPPHAFAERPIQGGLGVKFGEVVESSRLGAEITHAAVFAIPPNLKISLPDAVPGQTLPWRVLLEPNLPRRLRGHPYQAYVMLDSRGRAMRAIVQVQLKGCDDVFDWLKQTLDKNYDVQNDMQSAPPADYTDALHIRFPGKQIDVRCGPNYVVDYTDSYALGQWSKAQKAAVTAYERALQNVAKRRVVLNRRRDARFADLFTLGDQFSMEGAFGIAFGQPFARNSKQNFPIDVPFIAVLPNLPPEFAEGEIHLMISPERHPILIRGRFNSVTFDKVTQALNAKYGSPMKASDRHVIHKVAGNHVIAKRLSEDTIELAFIDTTAQAEQKTRLWETESEGL